jgi:hypothetical protein
VSVQPQPWPDADPQVAAAIRVMYRGRREAPLAVQVRDRLGEVFPDAAFADAFGRAVGWSPGRLALVTVLQKAANLTDRALAENVIRPGGRWCARCTGGRPAKSPEQALSRGWHSPRQDDRPCCCD